jgi:hypothetical protein
MLISELSTHYINEEFLVRVSYNNPPNIYTVVIDIFCNINGNKFRCSGFFTTDNLHIDTKLMTQCIYPEIYNKKKQLFISHKDNPFKRNFVENCNKAEIIALTLEELNTKILYRLALYDEIKYKTFEELKKEYLTDPNPYVIFNILNLLLDGTTEQINIAAMIYLSLYDSNSIETKYIYSSLSHIFQLKLKISIDFNNSLKLYTTLKSSDDLILTPKIGRDIIKSKKIQQNKAKLNQHENYLLNKIIFFISCKKKCLFTLFCLLIVLYFLRH